MNKNGLRWGLLLSIGLFFSTGLNAVNYYWVGGAGNWSDTNHWATASGGNTFHNRPPTARDNVFFDANSFSGTGQQVNIDIDAVCGDMIWTGATGNPVLDGAVNRSLSIFGSLTLIPGLQLTFSGKIQFQTDPLSPFNRIITSAGQVFPADVFFNGPDGQWALADSLAVEGAIFFERGSLSTNNRPITCTNLISDGNGARRINLIQSRLRLRRTVGEDPVELRLRADNLTFEARNATIEFLQNGALVNNGLGLLEYRTVIFRGDAEIFRENVSSVRIDTLRLQRNAILHNGFTVQQSLELSRGFEYQFASMETFTIRSLKAEGGCEGYVSLRSTIGGEAAFLRSAFNFNNTYLILEDIHNTGATVFRADQSIDLGNNDGWIINSPAPRTLYWVADGGRWYDSSHWSLSSGGPGGECPPTPLDDVFFDANSFISAAQSVQGEAGPRYYCHDMTWLDVGGTPSLDLANLQLHGSLTLSPAMNWAVPQLHLRSGEAGETLTSAGHTLASILVEGAGAWSLQDALSAGTIRLFRGAWITNNQPMVINALLTPVLEQSPRLELGASRITVQGNGLCWDLIATGTTLDGAGSSIELTHPNAAFRSLIPTTVLAYGAVAFTDPAGAVSLETGSADGSSTRFRALRFAGDAIIRGTNDIDSLFFQAGGAYQLEAGATQTVNRYWEMNGNPCAVISLTSTEAGRQALVRSAGATILAASVDMRDQSAQGGADFNAGLGSRDLGNNSGWRFLNQGTGNTSGFLGADRFLCNGASLTLDPRLSDQGQTYQWSDGSQTSVLTVTQAGEYSVAITYPGNCEIRDTIVLLPQSALRPAFGADTTLCAGATISLSAEVDTLGIPVAYRWQDGSTQPSFTVRQSGAYAVSVTASGCEERGSVNVAVVQPPAIELGVDRTACAGETVNLDATAAGADRYTWNTGAATPTLAVTQSGRYTVEVAIGRCARRDSLQVTFRPLPALELGPDRQPCDGETITLDATNAGATYQWSTGAVSPTLAARQSGSYAVTVTLNGCTAADAVQLNFQPRPQFELTADKSACEGDRIQLLPSFTGPLRPDTYRWSTGAASPNIFVTQSGAYWLDASVAGCTRRDTLVVTFSPRPAVELGPDQTLCEGQTATLDATNAGATYRWNTGALSPRLQVTRSGRYEVTVDLNGCTATDAVQFTFNPRPQINLGPDQQACAGESVQLDGASANGADAYRWSTGAAGPQLTVTQGGVYSLEANIGACFTRDTVQVDYVIFPPNLLGDDRQLCAGNDITLDAGVPYANAVYRWTTGAQSASIPVTQSGAYGVDIQVGRCRTSDEVNLTINPLPVFDLGEDALLCERAIYDLFIPVTADAYRWSDGSNKDALTVRFPGGLIWGEATLNGCTFRDSIRLDFQPAPRLDLGPDTTICVQRPLTLRASGSVGEIRWSTGSTGRTLQVDREGLYWAEVTEGICTTRDSIVIEVRECSFYQVFIPNAFSPNDDGVNDEFRPFLPAGIQLNSYRLAIFDRWGNQLFLTTDPDQAWDGASRGRALPQGVYVYVLEIDYTDDDGSRRKVESGDVALVR